MKKKTREKLRRILTKKAALPKHIVIEPKPLRVAMVSGAASANPVITRFSQGWEVWGLNAIYPPWQSHIRWARRFNLHRWEHLKRDWAAGLRAEINGANALDVPLYVLDPWRKGALKKEIVLPRESLEALPRGGKYHAGSFDIMVAYAISLGAKEISIHGVSLALDGNREEPISARACLEYWIGVAEGRGIKVEMVECDLFYQYHLVRSATTYGWDDVQLVEERGIPKFDPRP